jgi:O-acetyl-ADP-ribose deacetylase (regulator of RNase III)
MNQIDRSDYYFLASHESILELLQKGIWHTMSMNQTLEPIDGTTVTIVKSDGTEANATDARIEKYVRMTSFPRLKLESWEGNIASVFIVQIDPKVFKSKDTFTIKRIRDGAFEYLKNIMVDRSHILRIHVISRDVERKMRSSNTNETSRAPIIVSPELFPSVQDHPKLTLDVNFDLTQTEPETFAAAPPMESTLQLDRLKICKGDLLTSKMQTLVNTVNCVGVMGKGIALAFRNTFPAMFNEYRSRCTNKQVKLGEPYCYKVSPFRLIVNFPTKGHWKENSKIGEVEKGLKVLVSKYKEWGIQSMAIPPLGCGNGGLDWNDVLPLMQSYLSQMDIPIEIYAPHEANAFGQAIPIKRPVSSSESSLLKKKKTR